MHYNIQSVALKIRLLLLTMLITVAGFALVSQFSDNSYSDDTTRVRVMEMQEFLNDAEPLLDGANLDFFIAGFLIICVALTVYLVVSRRKVFPRLTFYYHIQPRSPPLH